MIGSRLVLASASPRRAQLLSWVGISYDLMTVQIDESTRPGETPEQYVRRLALAKAEAAGRRRPADWILAADTVVSINGRLLGKPRDRAEALSMLLTLSGRRHQVLTAYCLLHREKDQAILEHVVSEVEFRALGPNDIDRYISSGEIWDKAGAYGIQGQGSTLTNRIEGSYTNVVGLPVAEVLEALRRVDILDIPRPA